jgi:hypothetical protein
LAAILGWKVWTEDFRQAFIQTAGTILRNVYLKNLRGAEEELHLRPDQALRLLKPLYGLADAGDLLHAEFSDHHRNVLRMEELDSEPALYAQFQDDLISGMTGLYVEDTILTGANHFEQWTAAKIPYETLPRTFNNGDVLGQQVYRNSTTGRINVSQEKYARTLPVLEPDSSFSQYLSRRMAVAWMVRTRPDIAYEVARVARFSQVTEQQYICQTETYVNDLNSVIDRLHASANLGITFPDIDPQTAFLCIYSDSSYANNSDQSSQIGYISLLVDSARKALPLAYRSIKSRMVTRSVLAAETIALVEAYHVGYCLRHELSRLLGRHVSLTLATDSQTLFNAIG